MDNRNNVTMPIVLLVMAVLTIFLMASCGGGGSSSTGAITTSTTTAGGGGGGGVIATSSVMFASLSGSQEVPAVTTTAVGSSVINVDESTGKVRGFIVTSGLTGANSAHIHDGATGVLGPVIVPFSGGPNIWVIADDAPVLTQDQINKFKAGNLYVNVHTTANPTGEIRGQLDRSGDIQMAALSGSQEVPAVTATALGASMIRVDSSGRVSGFIVTNGLTGAVAAHIHDGAAGVVGPVIIAFEGGPDIWVIPANAAALTQDQMTKFLAGNLYVNVHTNANPTGEIRGQLDRNGTIKFASLSGSQEVPPVTTTAFGSGVLLVETSGRPTGLEVTAGLTGANSSHVHDGAVGVSGPVITAFSGGPDTWIIPHDAAAYTQDQITKFQNGALYMNVHTVANPTGEIRGQINSP